MKSIQCSTKEQKGPWFLGDFNTHFNMPLGQPPDDYIEWYKKMQTDETETTIDLLQLRAELLENGYTDEDWRLLYAEIDPEYKEQRRISEEEFTKRMSSVADLDHRGAQIRAELKRRDLVGDGRISPEELIGVIEQNFPGLDEDEWRVLVHNLDLDEDGRCNYEDFLSKFKASGSG
ncbi:unnamed protein product [Owenia fusiformis]|uniref:Uncharacterized protein n=1 Tax=Owenia fusiformis TaxID=6347 RepID=A0A8J1U050_OWEFU|nr:unnamed protein product [Owenia fusiformis]